MEDIMARVLRVGNDRNAGYEELQDLFRSAIDELKTLFGPPRRWPRSVMGPLLGLMDGMYRHDDWYGYAPRRALFFNRWSVLGGLLFFRLKKRAGYNDFLLTRWALLRDEETACELIERSKRADSVGCTLCWALRSLGVQYMEFFERFAEHIPNPNPEHMLKDMPRGADPVAVL